MLTRRAWISGLAATAAIVLVARRARAAGLVVQAPNRAVGAIAAAVGGGRVEVRIDPGLEPTVLRIGGKEADIGKRIVLKGTGPARARFLDDARNAPKLGANIRDALAAADPSGAADYAARHKAWSRPFARDALGWTKRLQVSSVHGTRIRDVHGRAALLEWAGATIDPGARRTGPAALAKLPDQPAAATPEAYHAYVETLVAAL